MPTDVREPTDAELEALLAEAAGAQPVPADGAAKVLAAARAGARPPGVARRASTGAPWLRWAAAIVVVVALAAAAVNLVPSSARRSADDSDTSAASGDSNASGVGEKAQPGVASTTVPAGGAPPSEEATGLAGGDAPSEVAPPPAQVPGARPRVVKTGSLEVEVRRGRFDVTVNRLTTLAAGAGGFVADSRSSEVGRSPSGTFTLRVPSARFEQVLTEVRRLGTVKVSSSSGEDVTAQFTDLEARITSLTATRDQLRTLQTEARTIPDILAVQDRLNGVQVELEQLQGQRKLLEDKASFGTLTVLVREPLPAGVDEPRDPPRSGFAKAWHDAVDGFTGGIQRLISGSGSFLVVLLCLVAILLAARAAWRVAGRRFI